MSVSEVRMQALKAKTFGNYGFYSKSATKRLIAKLEEISPDIVQLHNLHGHNVHLEMLFSYFKERKIKIFWTFHDCWAFTAYCMYFDTVQCNRWQSGCENCPQRKKYSWFFDKSHSLYEKKKELFSGLDMTIITPSHWLAELTKKSFLGNYPIEVIHNGIDLTLFSPQPSDFREKYGISKDQKILLGVANKWEYRKGLDVFLCLAEKLDKTKFKIVLVGTNDAIDKKIPSEILSIHRTADQKELAEIYSAADFFVNPTREDNFPTVNIEALACGTPVITFRTGGSPECIDQTCGAIIEKDDINGMAALIDDICDKKFFSEEDCIAHSKMFSANKKFQQYLTLYTKVNL
jgi:glycosyltransferase involved in cell wall biosynthesis